MSRPWGALVRDRQILSWALYDWANSAFATTVMAGFFPLFFKKYWSAGVDVNVSTFNLGNANSIASGALALLSPMLGAVADQASFKKRFLFLFSALGVVMTGAMYFVAQGDWVTAVVLYVLASIGFAGGNTFYDALLMSVAGPRDRIRVSAIGFSLGYLGGGVLFAINVLMTLKPHLFGLADNVEGVRVSFLTVAIWWAVFTIPVMLFVREDARKEQKGLVRVAIDGWLQVAETFREIRRLRNAALFLFSYFFYIDGVNTIIKMAVDYGLSLGFATDSLIIALLITQFVGFPATIFFGWLGGKLGEKGGLFIAIAVYVGVTIYAYFMSSSTEFYVLAIVIGLVQGGVQSLSRSVFAEMTPQTKTAEFFGFFNMLGKFSSVVGTALVGFVSLYTQSTRLSILSVVILFVIGMVSLIFVKIVPPAGGHATAPPPPSE